MTEFFVVDERKPAIVDGPFPTRPEAYKAVATDDHSIVSGRVIEMIRGDRPLRDERGDHDVIADGGVSFEGPSEAADALESVAIAAEPALEERELAKLDAVRRFLEDADPPQAISSTVQTGDAEVLSNAINTVGLLDVGKVDRSGTVVSAFEVGNLQELVEIATLLDIEEVVLELGHDMPLLAHPRHAPEGATIAVAPRIPSRDSDIDAWAEAATGYDQPIPEGDDDQEGSDE
jgi:hypothetical protein